MKLIYRYDETKEHQLRMYVEEDPDYVVRMVFEDGGDWFVVITNDTTNSMYLNRIVNRHYKPHMFFADNLAELPDDDQFYRYYQRISEISNFQALHDTSEDTEGWVPTFTVQ